MGAPEGLARNTTPLVDIAHDLRRVSHRRDARVLLVIDQFEELLGREQTANAASRLLELLRASIESDKSPLMVLSTMRSDFLGLFQRKAALQGVDFESLSLGPMRIEAMRRVIEMPVKLAAIELESGLADRLLEDTEAADALPLLSFTLWVLCRDRRDDGKLEVSEYEKLGGLQRTITREADAVLASASREHKEDDLRKALLQMARLSEDGSYARLPGSWDNAEIRRVVSIRETLVERRILVSRMDGDMRIVEVAHEAQVGLLAEFVRAGWRRRRRQRATLAATTVAVIAVLVGFLVYAPVQADRATKEKGRALDLARVSIAGEWLQTDPTKAALVLLEVEDPANTRFASRRLSMALNRGLVGAEYRHAGPVHSVAISIDGSRILTRFTLQHGCGVRDAWSSAGGSLAVTSSCGDGFKSACDPKVMVWDVRTGREHTTMGVEGAEPVGFSRNGKLMFSAHNRRGKFGVQWMHAETLVQVWDVDTGEERFPEPLRSDDPLITTSGNTALIWSVSGELLQSAIAAATTVCLKPEFRRQNLGESATEARRKYEACERKHGRER